ncbi:hypothetical protein ACVBE9_07140 [Eionea flava]
MSELDPKQHIDFYKHISVLSLATFAGCVTLIGVLNNYQWLLLLACYCSLASTFHSLYTIKTIISEGRIPYSKKGPITKTLGLYAPYKFLLFSLAIIAIIMWLSSMEAAKSIGA